MEEWARDLRLEVSYDFQRILERLAYNAAANGDLELALARARRALQLDSLNDEMHANVFQWMLDSGQRSKALEYCQYLSDLYRRQETPLPQRLEQLCNSPRVTGSQLQATPRNPWPLSLSTALPYIHRPELEQILKQSFQRGGRLLVVGEAGVGKTRLMYEVFRTLDPNPRLLLVGSHPSEQNLPYQALINALRHQVLQEEWLKLDRVWVSQLAHLLPELGVLRPDIEIAAHQVQGESTLYEALRQLLMIMAQPKKFLLILDDAQRYDPSTLNAVTYLCNRGFFNQHGLLVVAYRPEEETPALQQCVSAIAPGMPGYRLKVECFKSEEVSQLTQRILGQIPAPETTSRLLHETGGNPLFLLESLHLLLNYPGLDINQIGESPPLSGSLQALAHERMQRLSPIARQVIGVAAVIGEEFISGLVEETGNLQPEQVVQALEELEQARLIQPALASSHKQAYTFVYSKIREVLLLEMGPARQRMLHLRIARVLEKTFDPMSGVMEAILAEHYESAGETQTALDYWIKAGKHALHLFSPAEAQAAFERAERLRLQNELGVPDLRIYQLYKEWNHAVNAVGNFTQMREINLRLLEIGEKRLSPLLCGSALNGLARSALLQNQIQPSLQYCDRAALYLQQAEDQYESIRLNNIRGDCLVLSDQYGAAVEAFTRAIALSEEQQDQSLLDGQAHAEYSISEARLALGWPAQARDMALRCIQTSLKAKDASWAMKAYTMMALSEHFLGNLAESMDHARQGIKLAELMQSWRNVAYLKISQARTELVLGWIDDNWQHSLTAEELGHQQTLPRVLSWAASQRGQTLRFLRQFALATEAYQTGIEYSVFALDRFECQLRLGLSLASERKIEDSLRVLHDCLAQTEKANLVLIHLLAETSLLFVLVQNGRLEDVRLALPGLMERANERKIADVDIGVETIQAMLAQQEGSTQTAVFHARRALERSMQAGSLWWELNSQLLLAKLGEDQAAVRGRVQQLTDILMEHGQKTPELAPFVQLFIRWVNQEVGYT